MGKRRKKNYYKGPDITEKYNFFENQKIITKISDYDDNGVGRGYYEDEVPILVFNSIIGEKVEIEIIKIFPEKIIGRISNILISSEKRIKSNCDFFGNCTGCQWLHIDYDHQLELKKLIVKNNLEKNNLFVDEIIEKTISSDRKFYYRNHGRFTVRKNKDLEELGFVNFLSRKWTSVDHCKIMSQNINDKLKLLKNNLSGKTQVSIRGSDSSTSFLIQPKFETDLFESGQKYYQEKIFDNYYQVASPSFFQVNISQVEKIFNYLLDQGIFYENQIVIDAYCGVGTFTCLIAPYVKKIYGIEESASAIIDANINSNKFNNIYYIQGKTEDVLLDVNDEIDILLLDPPRIGCEDLVIQKINRIKPRKILLISCSPENFAIDMYKLSSIGYKIQKIIPFDMFPQTHHVEVVGILELSHE